MIPVNPEALAQLKQRLKPSEARKTAKDRPARPALWKSPRQPATQQTRPTWNRS